MLSLAYATAHPTSIRGLVLIGCGTFTLRTRTEFRARLDARMTPEDRTKIDEINRNEPDPNRRMSAEFRAAGRLWSYDADDAGDELLSVDAAAHEQSWADMLRLQHGAIYPAAFSAIECPVLMVHGADDPHPGQMTRDDLKPHIRQLEYRELSKCGHSPWLERQCREEFYRVLDEWISPRYGS
jgi:pimeloyl-ACP methyl ester carboxylesterase